MKSPEMGMGAPEQTAPNRESLIEAEKLFLQASSEFHGNKPDFSRITECVKDIATIIRAYEDDFTIILREEKEYSGGLEQNQERIKNMKRLIPELNAKIEEAESIIDSDESLFGPYRKQINAANKIIESLEKI